MSQTTYPRWATLSKAQAFALHLTLSLLAFSVLVFVMLRWWFPGELFFIDGGWQGLKLVAMVDLVLGPALTLLLYKPRKPKLMLDLSVIAAIQIAALGYGFITTWQQRTVAIVYAEGRFTSLSNQALKQANADLRARDIEAQPLSALSDARPAMLYTPPPDRENMGKHLADLLNGLPEPHERSDHFEPLAEARDKVQAKALDEKALKQQGMLEPIDEELRELGLQRSDVELHRFKTRYASGVAVFDPMRMAIISYVPRDSKRAAVAKNKDDESVVESPVEQAETAE